MLLQPLIFLLLALQPTSQPALLPTANAQMLGDRLGRLDSLTIHYTHPLDDRIEKWDVFITDRALLAEFEAMHHSDWHVEVLFVHNTRANASIEKTKYTGYVGAIKYADHPFALRLKPPNQPWELFIETGEPAKKLAKLVEDEAKRQRPENPVSEKK